MPLTYKKIVEKTCKLVKYSNNSPAIKITFPFDRETLEQVRGIPSRKYHPDGTFWTCPATIDRIELLRKFGFKIDEKLNQICTSIPETIEVIPGLKKQLYPFQKTGVSAIEQTNGRILIADEMGLGKTIQSIAWLQLHPEIRPVLIVVPASLKLNWKREIQQWTGISKITVIEGGKPYSILNSEIVIINYDVLNNWVELFLKIKFEVLILDECHYIKNNKAIRTKAVKKIAKHVPKIIALSGTPIINRPLEGYNIFQIINPNLFPNWMNFVRRYCAPRYNGFGMDYSGSSNTKELHDILIDNKIMIRRLKRNVLPELPEKTFSYIPMEIDNEREYYQAERDLIKYLKLQGNLQKAEQASKAEQITKIEYLKQIAVRGKLKQIINWIQDFLETDQKLVIFIHHKFVMEELIKHFGHVAVSLDGSTKMENRQKAVDMFQMDPIIRLFIGNIKAAGVGITLTASSNVAFAELPMTPTEFDQAVDRTHRIGQQNNVSVHLLLSQDTIEDRIISLIDNKRKIIDAVMDGKDTESENLINELIKQYKNEKD